MTITPAHTAATALPLGTDDTDAPVTWQLTDETGATEHGVVVGPRGSGGTTALRRLATAARLAGARTVQIDWDGGPTWEAAHERVATPQDLDTVLHQASTRTPDQGVLLLLVDGHRPLEDRRAWEQVLGGSRHRHVAVIARLYSLALAHTGGALVRDLLLSTGQYAALGTPRGGLELSLLTVLPGYQACDDWQDPGTGRYGRRGQARTLTIPA